MTDPSAPRPAHATPDYSATATGLATAPSPAAAPEDVRLETTQVVQPGLAAPAPRSRAGLIVAAVIGFIVLALVMLFVLAYLFVGLGPAGVIIGGIMALVPLTIVFWGIRWIDRWEPEPRGALVFAFLWGAGVSVLIALIVDAEIQNVIAAAGLGEFGAEFFGAAIQAPIVEEVGKGLGVLLLFFAVRRHFDGPVDGIVYSAWVAGGFAFTENILYFGSELVAGGAPVEVFFIRGIMSPFAHVMFTAFIGAAIGYAAQRPGWFRGIVAFLIGLVPAILLHAFWNGVLFFISDFYGYYLLVQVPMFLVAVWLVTLLRRQERRITFERLSEYAAVGWFHPEEVTMLSSPGGRRSAMAWARSHGLAPLMKAFIRDSTRLAYARQRILGDRDTIGAQADEAELLQRVAASRHALRGAAPTATA
ncbi:PrsW family intramembrane metalloprotease [Microcella humidisoli]|uniref:PrsW family intramembrane metalloprotease n=1 Tax=Microcella humidisoli TaxID=2963406 RepID=A0ABY5FUQ2_9MICO|nr:PrsW family intramembrane metalloprotease [Microcella humidisoli]UTT62018.1 PrsW family intramembrane metalloprotease [Microcella humidisoli]